MGKLTTAYSTKVLNHINRNTSLPQPAGLFLALFTTATSVAGGGTEVSGNGYSRQSLTAPTAIGGVPASNSNQISFTASGGNWGTITHVAVFSAVTGGEMIWQGPMAVSRIVNNTDTLVFEESSIDLSLT